MESKPELVFHEEQGFKEVRTCVVLATVPILMSLLLVWQVILGHPWGRHPLSNGNVIGWTIFVWIIYWRLITVKLVTDLSADKLSISMRGLWRVRHIPLSQIQSVSPVRFDAKKDFGGYGMRSIGSKRAYVAKGDRGVSLQLSRGRIVILGSQRAEELANAIMALIAR